MKRRIIILMGLKALIVISILLGIVVAFTGCTEQQGIYFDGELADQLNLQSDFDIIPGNTYKENHVIENRGTQVENVSFAFDSPEGIYCHVELDGETIEELSLEQNQKETITLVYVADVYLKSGSYQTTFWILP